VSEVIPRGRLTGRKSRPVRRALGVRSRPSLDRHIRSPQV